MSRLRSTKQRNAVRRALAGATDFRSAQELHADIQHSGETVGLATVYRTLTMLSESSEIDHLVGDDGELRYRSCSDGHHHHLVCRECGRTVEVEGQYVEEWAARTAADHGFTTITHTIELAGTCPGCAGI